MTNKKIPETKFDHPLIYQIRIRGHLQNRWKGWFANMTITLARNGETILTGPVVDQAALHGLLKKVRDLGLPLLSVNQVTSKLGTAPGPDQESFNLDVG